MRKEPPNKRGAGAPKMEPPHSIIIIVTAGGYNHCVVVTCRRKLSDSDLLIELLNSADKRQVPERSLTEGEPLLFLF